MIGAFEHVQRRCRLAAPVRRHPDVVREDPHQRIEIAGARCGDECRHELRMLRVDLTPTLERLGGAARTDPSHVRTRAGGKLSARSFAAPKGPCHFGK